MRWLYHLREAGKRARSDRYAPATFEREGFIHASYRDEVLESARLHFPAGVRLEVLQIDSRLLNAEVREAATPRGPMPHIHGEIPSASVAAIHTLEDFARSGTTLPDRI